MRNIVFTLDDFILIGLNVIIASLAAIFISKVNVRSYFSWYLIAAAFMQAVQFTLSKCGIHNIFLFHIWQPVEFALISLAFINWEDTYKDLYKYSSLIILILVTLDCMITPINSIPINSLVISSVVFTVFATRTLFSTQNRSVAIIAFGMVIYFSQSAAIFYLYQLTDIIIPLIYHKILNSASLSIFIYGYLYGRK